MGWLSIFTPQVDVYQWVGAFADGQPFFKQLASVVQAGLENGDRHLQAPVRDASNRPAPQMIATPSTAGVSWILGFGLLGLIIWHLYSTWHLRQQLAAANESLATDSLNDPWHVFEKASLGLARVGPDKRLQRVNSAFCQMLGYSEGELLQMTFADITHPDDLESSEEVVRKALAGAQDHFTLLKRYIHKDGHTVWGQLDSTFFKQADSGERYFITVLHDMTEFYLAQEAIVQQDVLINNILDHLPLGVAVNRISNQEIFYMNARFCEIYGWPQEAFPTIDAFFECIWPDPDFRADYKKRIMVDIASAEPERMRWDHAPITTATGETRYVCAQNLPLPEQDLMISTVQDVTDRTRTEKALALSERLSRTVIDSSPVAISVRGSDGQLLLHNTAWKDIWGISSSDISALEQRGRNMEIDTRFPYLGELSGDVERIFREGGELYIPEIDLRHYRPCQVDWISLYLFGQTNDTHGVERVITLAQDISSRKSWEAEMQASLQEKEMLLQEVHHRVKNNLQIISSLLDMQCEPLEDEPLIQIFRDSQNRVRTMALIHEQLYQSMDFTRVNFGIYIQNLVNYLYGCYSHLTAPVDISVIVDDVMLSPDTSITCGLLINELVSNALKYAFRISEMAEREEINQIIIRLKPLDNEPNSYEMTISDNGVGFSDQIDLEQPKTLGLQLVRMLIAQINGSFTVAPTILQADVPHRGVTFTIRFCDQC